MWFNWTLSIFLFHFLPLTSFVWFFFFSPPPSLLIFFLVSEEKLNLDESEWEDVHVVTGALKLFFRELPEPLIPYGFFTDIVETVSEWPPSAPFHMGYIIQHILFSLSLNTEEVHWKMAIIFNRSVKEKCKYSALNQYLYSLRFSNFVML